MSENTNTGFCAPWGSDWCKKRSFLFLMIKFGLIFALVSAMPILFLYRAHAGTVGITMRQAIIPYLLKPYKFLIEIFKFRFYILHLLRKNIQYHLLRSIMIMLLNFIPKFKFFVKIAHTLNRNLGVVGLTRQIAEHVPMQIAERVTEEEKIMGHVQSKKFK